MSPSSESHSSPFAPPSIVNPPNPSTLPPGLVPISPRRSDYRTDAEISAWLTSRHAVTSDKNVWAFWHSGFLTMRPWCRRNIINWVRRLGPDWTVHVVDCITDSETNVRHFVPDEYLPDAFINGTMDGPSVGPHSGDIVRLPLLWLYGGVWLDAGTLLFRHIDDICWRQMEDPNTPYEMAGFVLKLRPDEDAMINGFIAAKRNNTFIKRWHDIYAAMWAGGVTNADGFHKHPLLRHLPLLNPPLSNSNLELDVTMETFTDYLAHFVALERLRKLIDPNDGFNGPKYYRENILFAKAMEETFYVQPKTQWSGPRQFAYLTTRRMEHDGQPDNYNEKQREAQDFVHDALANSSTMKLSHGYPGGKDFLADLWDLPENENADCGPGTFAEYLRWGSVHLDQTRKMIPYKIDNTKEKVYHVGVLEAVEDLNSQCSAT